ncbi:MAG: hypothetical protein ACYDGR_04575 [Candidatus Dormibacteria bacterium]
MGRGSTALLILLIVVGALIGSILNEVLAPVFSVLKHSAGGTASMSLPVLSFSVTLKLTIGTAVGIIVGLLAYRRF